MKTREKIQRLLERLEGSTTAEECLLWTHGAAPALSDVGVDLALALSNQILTNMLILEQLFDSKLEVRWTGTDEDDVTDPALYQFRAAR
jgi:hypothetical protein